MSFRRALNMFFTSQRIIIPSFAVVGLSISCLIADNHKLNNSQMFKYVLCNTCAYINAGILYPIIIPMCMHYYNEDKDIPLFISPESYKD